MNVSDISQLDRAANGAAVFLEAQEGGSADSLYLPPRVELAGAYVDVYVRDGVLVVAIETKGASTDVFRLVGTEDSATVPVAVALGEGRPLVGAVDPGEPVAAGRHRKEGG